MKNKLILAAIAAIFLSVCIWSQMAASRTTPAYRASITVSQPAAGARLCSASSPTIFWRARGVSGPLRIDLIRAGDDRSSDSVLEIAASTANNGHFVWYIPSSLAAGDYKVRVRSVSGSPIDYGESAGFTVRACPAPSITVTSPLAGESWCLDSSHRIRWTSQDVSGPFDIEVHSAGARGGFIMKIAQNIRDTGFHVDSIPFTEGRLDQDGDYKIRVRTVSETPLVYGESGTLQLKICWNNDDPRIEIISPTRESKWTGGSTYEIRWRVDGAPSWNNRPGGGPPVSITLAGEAQREIIATTINDGSFSWRIPFDLPPGKNYRIRIQLLNKASLVVFGESDFFEIEQLKSLQVKPIR